MPEAMGPGSSRQNADARQRKKQKNVVVKSAKLKRLAEKQRVDQVEKSAMEYVSRI
jgi:ATP-dependent RNA helicase DDX10/DBP4